MNRPPMPNVQSSKATSDQMTAATDEERDISDLEVTNQVKFHIGSDEGEETDESEAGRYPEGDQIEMNDEDNCATGETCARRDSEATLADMAMQRVDTKSRYDDYTMHVVEAAQMVENMLMTPHVRFGGEIGEPQANGGVLSHLMRLDTNRRQRPVRRSARRSKRNTEKEVGNDIDALMCLAWLSTY